jgi:pantetheine-phosphate adenylyltransferase
MIAVYPGTFDPVTNGHLDVIERASALSQHLTVAILNNVLKTPLFTLDERIAHLHTLTAHLGNVRVVSFWGLQVDLAAKYGANVIIRGVRSCNDFEAELTMALGNRHMSAQIETLFIPTNSAHSFVHSGLVKEIAGFGGDVSGMVPPLINNALTIKLENKKQEEA